MTKPTYTYLDVINSPQVSLELTSYRTSSAATSRANAAIEFKPSPQSLFIELEAITGAKQC
jgi:hypothetical protein